MKYQTELNKLLVKNNGSRNRSLEDHERISFLRAITSGDFGTYCWAVSEVLPKTLFDCNVTFGSDKGYLVTIKIYNPDGVKIIHGKGAEIRVAFEKTFSRLEKAIVKWNLNRK